MKTVIVLTCLLLAACSKPTLPTGEDIGPWQPLISNDNEAAWISTPHESANDWSFQEGTILGKGSSKRQSYLVYQEALSDFELKLSYRIPREGNSGISIRMRPDETGKRAFESYHADLGHVGIGPHILGAWDFHFATRKEHPCDRGTSLLINKDESI